MLQIFMITQENFELRMKYHIYLYQYLAIR
jgi:hypothetical protein